MSSHKISIAADQHIFEIKQLECHPQIDLHLYNPHNWNPSYFHNSIDALLIRTVTSVDQELLTALGERLKYIGTATSGSDHIDKNILQNLQIAFSDAKGCNSKAVAEYTLTALLHWCDEKDLKPDTLTIGIAGIGHVGSKVDLLCREAGFETRCYDPVRREHSDDDFSGCSDNEFFFSDIITLHTPLTTSRESAFPTQNWISKELITHYKNVKLWINAARGGIINDSALAECVSENHTEAVIDCWKNEPVLNELLLRKAFLATPHIAGYSVESKLNATRMCVSDFLRHFDLSDEIMKEKFTFSDKRNVTLTQDLKIKGVEEILSNHGILSYQQELRACSCESRPQRFQKIRTEHQLRREFGWIGQTITV